MAFEDDLTTTTVKIYISDLIEMKRRGLNVSKYVRNLIKESLYDPEIIKNDIKKLQKLLKNGQKTAKKGQKMDEKEAFFIKKSIEIIEKNPNFLIGRCKLFENTFQKKITPEEFLECIEQIKGGNEDEK